MGPLVTKAHFDKVKGYVDLGVDEGADLVADGRGLVVDGHEDGYFLGPCLFDRVTAGMRIYEEEIFGPVLCVVRAESEEQAMQMIDDHEYGNGTCIFTRDGEAARYFADNIKVGMVGINVPLPVPVAYHSFGGWKRSLFGDLYAYGPDSVRFYTRQRAFLYAPQNDHAALAIGRRAREGAVLIPGTAIGNPLIRRRQARGRNVLLPAVQAHRK
jgi:malonate-semialdehyde dehydrogenase (acetylating)/methylmalonate-semialdehyde dehydrogenase